MNDLIDLSKVVDNMEPYEYRFKNNRESEVMILPLTKYGQQYFLVKQCTFTSYGEENDFLSIKYYIISGEEVIGRFDVGSSDKKCGITYHIVPSFQNKGIGQLVLRYVVADLFDTLDIEKIITLPINDRSRAIASKCGFDKKKEKVYELTSLAYHKTKKSK